MPKTLVRHDDVPFFDELVLKLGSPFDALLFAVSDEEPLALTSPTDPPTITIDERPFHDDEDYLLNDLSNWPAADADQTLPPLASAALSALATLDSRTEIEDET